jgi:tight adherence protein B
MMVLTFVAAALVVLGIYSFLFDLFLRDRARLRQRLDDHFSKKQRQRIQKSPLFKDLGKFASEAAEMTKPSSWRARVEEMLEQSGLELSLQRLFGIMAAVGFGVGALVGLLTQSWWGGPVAGLGAATLPFLFVHFKRRARIEKMLSQLPDALELISRLIRAGQTMSQAFQGVADEFQPPIALEFAYCAEQQNLGLSPEVALRDLGRRIGLVEVKIFILAVLVQRQTGGNLAELIDNLASLVRERFRIRGKIRVLTAEGRMEAAVLLALPPVVYGLILLVNRPYGLQLLEHPNLIWGMLVFMLIGVLWIRKIINFDF